jgi:hypothetical protein
MSFINSGASNPMYGRTGENYPYFSKLHNVEYRIKISKVKFEIPLKL